MKLSWRRIMLGSLILASAGMFFASNASAVQIKRVQQGIANLDADIVVSTILNTRHLSLRAGSSKRFFSGQLHKMVAVPIFPLFFPIFPIFHLFSKKKKGWW